MSLTAHDYSLHMIFSPQGWEQARTLVEPQDRVIFLQDSVYILQGELNSPTPLLYARSLDVLARNISLPSTSELDIEAIDDELWVKLTAHAQNIMSWK